MRSGVGDVGGWQCLVSDRHEPIPAGKHVGGEDDEENQLEDARANKLRDEDVLDIQDKQQHPRHS